MMNLARWLCFLSAALLLGGCASTGYQKSQAAAGSLDRAANQVQQENQAIDLVIARLNELVSRPAPDLRPQFKKYNAALDRLIGVADKSQARGADLKQKHEAYFILWDRQLALMSYDAVRDRSDRRRQEVIAEFEAVDRRYSEAHEVLPPLIDYFRDIRNALETDLTHNGLESVKPVVENAGENSRRVQSALARLSQELEAFRSRISAVTPPDAAAPRQE